MKYFYWICGLIISLLLGLAAVVSFLDWNEYRDTLAELATNQTGMQVELAGDVQASLFPRPSMSVESVRLSPLSSEGDNTIATADKIDVRLGVASILRGVLTIQSLALSDVRLTVEQSGEGVWRVRGWPETEDEDESGSLDLERFELNGGHIQIVPYATTPYAIEGIDLAFDGTLPTGPLAWEGAFFTGGEKVVTMGRLTPVVSRPETALQAEVFVGNTHVKLSTRFLDKGIGPGRVQFTTDNKDSTARSFAAIFNTGTTSLPAAPFDLDLQFVNEQGVIKLQSNTLALGDTRGRFDATLATSTPRPHITGLLSLGVIDLDTLSLLFGKASVDAKPAAPAASHNVDLGIDGSLDIAVEGIRLKGGLGQRIDGVVSFGTNGASLTSLQALLPGATSVAFSGAMGMAGGAGKLQLRAGDLSEFARWLEVDLTKDIPAGRLKTASLKGDIEVQPDSWTVNRIQALVDTTIFTGSVKGEGGSYFPTDIQLVADSLNIDAYMAGGQETPGAIEYYRAVLADITGGQNTHVALTISKLQLFETGFENISLKGALNSKHLTLTEVLVGHKGGTLSIRDSAAALQQNGALTVNASLKNWSLPLTRSLNEQAGRYLAAAHIQKVDGSLSVAGPLDNLRVGVDVKSAKNTLLLSGGLGLSGIEIVTAELQGSLAHSNIAPLLQAMDIAGLKAMPVSGTISFVKTGKGAPYDVRVGGNAAGGKLQADVSLTQETASGRVSFDHGQTAALQAMLNISLPWLMGDQALHADLDFIINATAGNHSVTLHSLRNGKLTANGALAIKNTHIISGALKVAGVDLDRVSGTSSPSAAAPYAGMTSFGDYAGTVTLDLNSVAFLGQTLTAPRASIILGDGLARFESGAGAQLNGGKLALKMDVDLRDKMPFHAALDAADIDVGAALASRNVGKVIAARTAVKVTLAGDLETGLPSLKGAGNSIGSVGALNFLSVPSLVSEMSNAKSSSSFLGGIGTFLRNGSTAVNKLESSFVIDSGVLLVEKAEAGGPWGALVLDGQVNLGDRYLSLAGALNLINPPDTPPIPVKYAGSFDGPTAEWSSRIFERFVLAGIEQRLRGSLFKQLETKTEAEDKASNPGLAVFNQAFGFLEQLKRQQKAAEDAKTKSAPQDAQEQTP